MNGLLKQNTADERTNGSNAKGCLRYEDRRVLRREWYEISRTNATVVERSEAVKRHVRIFVA